MTRAGRATLLATALLAFAALLAPSAQAQQAWRLEQPPPPSGSPFPVPLGQVGDIQFWAPNRGLLITQGTGAVPKGLYVYDGRGWRIYSRVCGAAAAFGRIAWAAPTEFWTIADTSPEQPFPKLGESLCRFRGGAVINSFAALPEAPDPYFRMNAATCAGPSNCWFGGEQQESPGSERSGAFHLSWNGDLRTVYAPQGRGVSDLEAHTGRMFESVFVGPRPNAGNEQPILRDPERPEDPPRLIHEIVSGTFVNDPFVPAARPALPANGSELLALDSDGTQLWAAGGGAANSGSSKDPRPPLAARLGPTGFSEVRGGIDSLADNERIVDIAAVPGTTQAWAAVQTFGSTGIDQRARVVRIGADGTIADTQLLPPSGPPRGAASKIACPAADRCWMVTTQGWLFHWSNGTQLARDTEPAFNRVIDSRPRDARSPQIRPDTPPVDDSELLAPPPEENKSSEPEGRRRSPLIRSVRTKLRGRRTLVFSFRLTRRARVQILGLRGRKVVAKTRKKTLRAGRRKLTMRVNPRRYPKRVRFKTRELGRR